MGQRFGDTVGTKRDIMLLRNVLYSSGEHFSI